METRRPDDLARVAERDAIGQAFSRLDPDLQLVVALRYYRDLPLERVAELLGVPLGTVKSRSHRAHRKLASLLGHLRSGIDD